MTTVKEVLIEYRIIKRDLRKREILGWGVVVVLSIVWIIQQI